MKGGDSMIEIHSYMRLFCAALEQTFARRVWFVGLQGSYARGGEVDFDPMSEALFSFAGKWIKKIEKI